MKKRVSWLLLIITIAVLALSFGACKPNSMSGFYTKMEYKEKNKVADKSAYDLMLEATENWINDTAYMRTEYYHFQCNLASRKTKFVTKRNGNEFSYIEYRYGTGVDSKTRSVDRIYENGSIYKNSKIGSKESGISVFDSKGKFDFETKSIGTLETTDFATVENKLKYLKSHMTSYDYSKRDYLSKDHDDSVYLVDGTYYFTVKMNITKEAMDSYNASARDEFIKSLGASEGSLEMTKMELDFAVKEINGKMKIMYWYRAEDYTAKNGGIIPVPCTQVCLTQFDYSADACKIVESDKI